MECGWTSICLKDLISYLPDGILVSILSRLEIEQAARTSALARRWRYLWTFTSSLIFKFCDWRIVDHEDKLFGLKCRQFVDWVNHILKFHRGMIIDEFSIQFCLDDNIFKSDIDGWINFAFRKRVKRLKFNFRCTWTNGNWNYPLTAHILHYHRLDSLTSLYLCHVDVTREVLEYILFVCPLLEELSILHSRSLFWDFKDSTKETKIRRPKHLHKSLKVLELNGFIGCKADLQIASYILGSTVSLQEIIIDPSHPNKWAPEDPDTQQLARMRARQHLETRLPFGTQLVLR
ncbi:F-box/LRR-repeat protein At3g03360-like isoform X7 [Camellia sinensis]|uniref:F-box/LRR-repeat protein At3g03360-like isoform X7 n=1 Tax=Camellia sinensis TaxID=4442 RepID=UPI001036C0B8|nr:F-box/LRR-repeat protein At3g03360-like isoform X7 [Camellia sinensis]